MASDPHDLRFPVLHLDAHFDAARVVDLDSLFDHEGRPGQLAARREVCAARAGRAPGRRVLDPEIRDETPRVDGRTRRLAAEGEDIADDLLTELGENLAEGP